MAVDRVSTGSDLQRRALWAGAQEGALEAASVTLPLAAVAIGLLGEKKGATPAALTLSGLAVAAGALRGAYTMFVGATVLDVGLRVLGISK